MTVDVSEFASQIAGTVLTPGNEGYEETLKRWATNSERKAAVVVLVASAADVAAAVVPLFLRPNVSLRLQRRVALKLQSVEGDTLLLAPLRPRASLVCPFPSF